MNEAVDRAVTSMTGTAALPRDDGVLVFEAPWQGRALGMAVTVVDRLRLDWDEFRQWLIGAIADQPGRPYYESWVAALEALLVDSGVVAAEDLSPR